MLCYFSPLYFSDKENKPQLENIYEWFYSTFQAFTTHTCLICISWQILVCYDFGFLYCLRRKVCGLQVVKIWKIEKKIMITAFKNWFYGIFITLVNHKLNKLNCRYFFSLMCSMDKGHLLKDIFQKKWRKI